MSRFGVVLALIVLFIGFSIALPNTFFTSANVRTMINSQAVVLMLAIAATIPLRAGEFDLSVAAVMTAGAAITGELTKGGSSPGLLVALVAVIAFGIAIGLLNSLLVLWIGVDSFIVTLGTMTAVGGAAYAITGAQTITGFSHTLLNITQADFLGLPTPTWLAWLLVAVIWYVYERTPAGRYLLFIGGNRDATRLAGVRVDWLRAQAFVACAVISSITGFVLAGSIGSVDPSISNQYLLQPFAAAFLGVTTITVGRFNALGTLAGLYLLVIGITGLQLYGAQPWVSDVFNGTALVIAVSGAQLASRRSARRG